MFFPKRTIFCVFLVALIFSVALFKDLYWDNYHQPHSSLAHLRDNDPPSSFFSTDTDQDHSRMLSWVKNTASKLRIPLSNSISAAQGVEHGSVIMPKMSNDSLRAELGRSSWHLIHVMASKYPNKPKLDESQAMRSFIYLFGRLYPCGDCATHFQDMLDLHPPEPHLTSRDDLSQYFCKLHNKVNLRLGHPIFDCNLVGDRWKCGCADDGKKDTLPSYASNGKFGGAGSRSNAEKVVTSPEDEEEQRMLASLSPIERKMRMESRSLFPEDYLEAVSQASEVPPRYPVAQNATSTVPQVDEGAALV